MIGYYIGKQTFIRAIIENNSVARTRNNVHRNTLQRTAVRHFIG